jgi:2-methylcitrate dehydratase
VTPASFSRAHLQDAEVQALMGKMTVDEDEQFTRRFPDENNCRMEVTTSSGQRFEAHAAHQPGHWRNPLSDAQVVDKFNRLAEALLVPEQRTRAVELIWSLEQASSLRQLFDTLVLA